MKPSLQMFQPLGRALMLPIAVLPIAGLLLRLGQPDLLDIPFVAAAGAAIFDNLGLLFAAGIAVGLAKDGNGAAGLAGIVCFLVATRGAETLLTIPPGTGAGLTPDVASTVVASFRSAAVGKLSVPVGILSGVIAGLFYNRYATIRLPDYLAFFGGRRFVPILSGFAGLALAAVVGWGYAPISSGIDGLSRFIIHSGVFGLFLYGVVNRLLIVTGLHHIVNNLVWFIIGDFHGTTGDLNRFFAGDPTAGAFMAGYFPVMMFGLPAACLAMYRSALPERRAAVGGMLLSMALTAFLTGVTEPIEFSFMFLAPALYGLHAVLTGLSMALMDLLGVKLGFGFSAGFLDYALNFSKATRPLVLIPFGLFYFALYYALFRYAIIRFDLKTPGREAEPAGGAPGAAPDGAETRGSAFVAALGGAANLVSINACTTRLRLIVADQDRVDEARLKALGARGFIRPTPDGLQVVLGPIADAVAMEMQAAAGDRLARPQALAASAASPSAAPEGEGVAIDLPAWLAALGGRANFREVKAASSRIRLTIDSAERLDEGALARLGVHLVARPAPEVVHLIVGPQAPAIARRLEEA